MDEKYYGKYRGLVLNNVDPLQKGRLLVQVPDVLGLSTSSWAMPCVPVAGPQMGTYFIPIIGSGVWIEFEGGNPDYPIWTGGFWDTGSCGCSRLAQYRASDDRPKQHCSQRPAGAHWWHHAQKYDRCIDYCQRYGNIYSKWKRSERYYVRSDCYA